MLQRPLASHTRRAQVDNLFRFLDRIKNGDKLSWLFRRLQLQPPVLVFYGKFRSCCNIDKCKLGVYLEYVVVVGGFMDTIKSICKGLLSLSFVPASRTVEVKSPSERLASSFNGVSDAFKKTGDSIRNATK